MDKVMSTKTLLLTVFSIGLSLSLPGCLEDANELIPGQTPVEPAKLEASPGATDRALVSKKPDGSLTQASAAPAQPSVPIPKNIELNDDNLFGLNTDKIEYELTLHGTRSYRLVGRLASPDGKREILLNKTGARITEEVFSADWLLPAVGAVNANGNMLVCVNRLAGEPSSLTEGNMPDPTQGVDLMCRIRVNGIWENEVTLPRHATGHWLYDVTVVPGGGYRVAYSGDSTGLMVDDPQDGDGMYRVVFEHGVFRKPAMSRPFRKVNE